jgi:hypothetical protein
MRASRDARGSTPEVEALPCHNPLQYLHLTSLQIRPEKLLTVSAAADHVMQLLLVKSQSAPSSYAKARRRKLFTSSFVMGVQSSSGQYNAQGVFILVSFLYTMLPCSQRRKHYAPRLHHPIRDAQSGPGNTCNLCQRREQFAVEALKAQHGGDVKMARVVIAAGG